MNMKTRTLLFSFSLATATLVVVHAQTPTLPPTAPAVTQEQVDRTVHAAIDDNNRRIEKKIAGAQRAAEAKTQNAVMAQTTVNASVRDRLAEQQSMIQRNAHATQESILQYVHGFKVLGLNIQIWLAMLTLATLAGFIFFRARLRSLRERYEAENKNLMERSQLIIGRLEKLEQELYISSQKDIAIIAEQCERLRKQFPTGTPQKEWMVPFVVDLKAENGHANRGKVSGYRAVFNEGPLDKDNWPRIYYLDEKNPMKLRDAFGHAARILGLSKDRIFEEKSAEAVVDMLRAANAKANATAPAR